jgi:hypothetical protein
MSRRELTAFGAFEIYVGVKRHFTHMNVLYKKNVSRLPAWATMESFVKRKDAKLFGYLASLYPESELEGMLVANFVFDAKMHVSDLLSEEARERYVAWQARVQSLTYCFEQEVMALFDRHGGKPFKPAKKPPFIADFFRGELSPETSAICTYQMGGFPHVEDDLLWPKARMRLMKYNSFLDYSSKKIQKILLENIQRYNK